jgi:hypothetical protein
MTPFDVLEASLLDLLYELRDSDIRLMLGGGYGLYLKEEHIRQTEARTLLATFPQARSTNDLDIFLHTEVLADTTRVRAIRAALDRLDYKPKLGAEYYQFVTEKVKIDLLTGPEALFDPQTVRIETGQDSRRIKPKVKGIGLHAHSTEEAVTLQEELITLPVEGARPTGEIYRTSICLPHPYTYATMKLFATRDKEQRGDKENSSKHALDLYRVIAMITEEEWETTERLSRAYHQEPAVKEAAKIARESFGGRSSLGMLRMREHPQFSRDMDIETFLQILSEIFPEET